MFIGKVDSLSENGKTTVFGRKSKGKEWHPRESTFKYRCLKVFP